jgi:hypothetical protein
MVRAQSLGTHPLLVTSWYGCDVCQMMPFVQVAIVDPLADDGVVIQGQLPTSWYGERSSRLDAASDGTRVLVAEPGGLNLWDLATLADPVGPGTLAFPGAVTDQRVRIAWMANGRAWVGWQAADGEMVVPGPHLMQVSYSQVGMPLSSEGSVLLPAPVDTALEVGPVTVAATRSGLVIVAPACR